MNKTPGDQKFDAITDKLLSDNRPIPLTVQIADAFVILEGVALAARAPGLGRTRDIMTSIVRDFRKGIGKRHGAAVLPVATPDIIARAIADKTPIPVRMTVARAHILVSALQLAVRHPDVTANPRLAGNLEHYGRMFQASIVSVHPEADELIELGWNPMYDSPAGDDK